MRDCKPQGFEIQDYRLGGLIQRNRHCLEILRDYITGKISAIPELEEPQLDFSGNGFEFEKKHRYFNEFPKMISAGLL